MARHPASQPSAEQTWGFVPAGMIAALRPQTGSIVHDMVRQIERTVPEYVRDGATEYQLLVWRTAEATLLDLLGRLAVNDAAGERAGPSAEPAAPLFKTIGHMEARSGRDMGILQGAMHAGAQAMWQRLSRAFISLGMPSDTLCKVAAALLQHFEENSAAAVEGYAEARAKRSDRLQRSRRRLLDLILSEPPASAESIAKLAKAAEWPVPRAVAAVALHERRGRDGVSAPPVAPDVLMDLDRPDPCLVVPSPENPARRKMIDFALRDWSAAVGPAVSLANAAKSLNWARAALVLARRGIIASTDVIYCSDHMAALVLFQNEDLIRTFAVTRLAPLMSLRQGQRDRLAETLLAWLESARSATEAAARLYVHPQTVRYRLGQLKDLFGDQLHDPSRCFELEMALRAQNLLATGTGSAPLESAREPGKVRPAP